MTFWELATAVLPVALVPCAVAALWGTSLARAVAVQLASSICAFELIALGAATHQSYLADLALCTVVVGNGGSFVFARVLRRWL